MGYSLPALSDGEPWERIRRGLPSSPGSDLETRVAEHVAALLESRPEISRPGDRPREVLYNLLKLCGALSRADILGRPLKGMLKRGKLSGDFDGTNLRAVLRDALIRNQNDQALWPAWQTMLEGKRYKFLPGDASDGVEGVAWMPSLEAPTRPDLEKVGWALAKFAEYLGRDAERLDVFEEHLRRLAERWGSRLRNEFSSMAKLHRWPKWTKDAIDVDPPTVIPSMSPGEWAIIELKKLELEADPRERRDCESIIKEIEMIIPVKQPGETTRDWYCHQNYSLVLYRHTLDQRRKTKPAEALERGRRKYMAERGIKTAVSSGE